MVTFVGNVHPTQIHPVTVFVGCSLSFLRRIMHMYKGCNKPKGETNHA